METIDAIKLHSVPFDGLTGLSDYDDVLTFQEPIEIIFVALNRRWEAKIHGTPYDDDFFVKEMFRGSAAFNKILDSHREEDDRRFAEYKLEAMSQAGQ